MGLIVNKSIETAGLSNNIIVRHTESNFLTSVGPKHVFVFSSE